jgi:DNA helicase-2/ATP-dependent DNA helicase PcrA
MALLNPEQKKAVESIHGRILVLAGAGSGKTSVLISRCTELIDKHGVPPSNILGLTFTNKAAEEMRQRISKRIGSERAKQIVLSTFHSFCLRVLKQEIHRLGYTGQFSIYDERDMERLEETVERGLAESGKEEINDTLLQSEVLKMMKAYNAVNFDGLLSLTVELFQNHPLVLKSYQDRFRYVMIDEYQDTNNVQYELASLLTKESSNLFVVGDDDQSIYGWRGAEIEHILNFNHQIKIKLEENYRSTKQILDTANALIKNNTKRHDKNLWSRKVDGDPVHIFHAPNQIDEADAVVNRISVLRREKNLRWSDFAILYRSNTLSRPFEAALMRASWKDGDRFVRGIPYRVVQGTEFYERAEVKDFISYLQVLVNPQDQRALLRILNYPRRGVSMKTIEELTTIQKREKIPLWDVLLKATFLDISEQGKKGVEGFLALIKDAKEVFEKEPIHKGMAHLAEKLDLKNVICQEFKSEEAQKYKWDNIQTLIAMAEPTDENPSLSLHDFLSNTMLDQAKQDKGSKNKGDRVNLLTLHSAKGLEFAACFIVSVEEGILPHERSLQEKGLEEERRLFYVGITRAKKYLTISMAKKRSSHGKERPTTPSRFLFELPKETLLAEPFERPSPFIY